METMKRIEETRIKKGLTGNDIAKKINVSRSVYSQWKSGESESYKKYLPQIADLLGVSVNYLITGKETEAEAFYTAFQKADERTQKAIKILLAI